MAQVDIGFGIEIEGQGLTELQKLEKMLEEIEKKSTIKIKPESSGGLEDAKERNKQETIAIQNLQIKQKLIEAENKGYVETQIQLKKLLDINEGIIRQADEIVGKKASEAITQKQWEELKLIEKKESSIRKQKEEEIRLTQEVNKALLENKKISDSVLKEKTQQQISDQYGGFSKSKELEDMKKFYLEQNKENKKAQELEIQLFNQNLKLRQDALKQKQEEEYKIIQKTKEEEIKKDKELMDRLQQIYEFRQKIETSAISSQDKGTIGTDLYKMETNIEKGVVDENFKYKLDKLKEYLSIVLKENISIEKLIAEETSKLNKNKILENAINNSKIEKDKKIELLKEIDTLNKNIFDADYKVQYSNIQKLYQEEKKKAEELTKIKKNAQEYVLKETTQQQISAQYGGFETSKELVALKNYYQELEKETKKQEDLRLEAVNQRIKKEQDLIKQSENKKKQEIANRVAQKDKLFSLETEIIKNNLQQQRYLKESENKKTYLDKLKELQQTKTLKNEELKEFEQYIKRKTAINQSERSNFTQDLSQLMALRQVVGDTFRNITTMEQFEDAVYQMGIIGGKTGVEIRKLRSEMLDLGSTIPRSTIEIVRNLTKVERTGRSYAEASTIIENSSKLAIVSGENMADATNVLNKSLIAFDINVNRTAEVMDILHSAAAATPLDLNTISDGMKNSASSMRNFIENTNKSGEELEDYKIRLLELNTALIGNQMQMG